MERGDDLATITSIGVLGYTSADVAHHLFGHAAACLVMGGQVKLVTSQLVRCTVTGSAVDLAGPLASLGVGLAALLAGRLVRPTMPVMRLLLILVAVFNLFWFNLQLVYSAWSQKDDWAWALQAFHVPLAGRALLIFGGALGYYFTVRVAAGCLKSYAVPKARIYKICLTAWLSAGLLACVTALFDQHQGQALRGALPQAMILSIGLIFVPSRAYRMSKTWPSAAGVEFSPIWIGAAGVVAAASVYFLGRGFSI